MSGVKGISQYGSLREDMTTGLYLFCFLLFSSPKFVVVHISKFGFFPISENLTFNV